MTLLAAGVLLGAAGCSDEGGAPKAGGGGPRAAAPPVAPAPPPVTGPLYAKTTAAGTARLELTPQGGVRLTLLEADKQTERRVPATQFEGILIAGPVSEPFMMGATAQDGDAEQGWFRFRSYSKLFGSGQALHLTLRAEFDDGTTERIDLDVPAGWRAF